MSRWTVPIVLVAAWMLFGVIGSLTRGTAWFALSGVALLAGAFAVVVAIIGAIRDRGAQRREQLELLREIAAQGRNTDST